ncbi:MAG TPA: PepSY domain-containing protein [Pseudomonas xinjiangensis]|uniref:PepSY domain-containing protein n=2 Tax=root TaxID=1 RepID=A0A7V1BQM3_9GAMM|nr:PepSY domain-containing protein [Halopseudomonas xinjiangensis]HEC46155.1 PepSY domain-containing protein [Halopseudomonas xinjiangensis]
MAPGSGFRQSMDWLHTWAGVLLGGLLLAVFWTGTLSVFDREIDRWMQPGTRLAEPPAVFSLDRLVLPHAKQVAAGAPVWDITLPTARMPAIQLDYHDPQLGRTRRFIDPRSGDLIPEQGSWGATRFIFPFHFSLHLGWRSIGYWLVGLAGMGMLMLVVSGVVAHRKLFKEFFTFRPRKRLQRSTLDLHNLCGVLALPFHVMISLSGLIIFFLIYFPSATDSLYPEGKQQFQLEALGVYSRLRADEAAPIASLDSMRRQAVEMWADRGPSAEPYMLRVWHPGDRHAYVEVRRSFAREMTMNVDRLIFDGASGALLHQHRTAPITGVQRFFTGLHFIQYDHWTLRWLYFAGGLCGCVMIITGLLFWIGARRERHARRGLLGARLVESLSVASSTGLILATLAFFIANRVLPMPGDNSRAALEGSAFFLVWLLALMHGAIRSKQAWGDQLWAIVAFACSAVALNWLSTGDHLLRSLNAGMWAVAGMDLMLLVLAGMSALVARRISQAEPQTPRLRQGYKHGEF